MCKPAKPLLPVIRRLYFNKLTKFNIQFWNKYGLSKSKYSYSNLLDLNPQNLISHYFDLLISMNNRIDTSMYVTR